MKIIILSFGLLAFSGLLFLDDSHEQEKLNSEYCKNVQIWNDSGQESGHPDYKNQFSLICEK